MLKMHFLCDLSMFARDNWLFSEFGKSLNLNRIYLSTIFWTFYDNNSNEPGTFRSSLVAWIKFHSYSIRYFCWHFLIVTCMHMIVGVLLLVTLACFGRDIMDMFSGSKKPWCLYVLRSCLKSKVFPPLHGSNVLPKHSTFSEVRGKGIKKNL